MGKAMPPAEGYRDDPDAVSLHTTPDNYTYDDAPEIPDLPPSYTDIASTSSPITPRIHHIPPPSTRTDHNNPSFKLGKPVVCETATLMDPKLDTDPQALEHAICTAGNDMPVPYIYIMGTHKETIQQGTKKETQHITDFRIVLNLQPYINNCHGTRYHPAVPITTVENTEKTYRGTISKCRAPSAPQDVETIPPKPTLQEWCHRSCASPHKLRIFRLERPITGLDHQYLTSRLHSLITSLQYRGNISITFPVEDRYLDIYTSNTINKWRLHPYIKWLFYLSFLWLFTWPYLALCTKRYAVVSAQWPFSVIRDDGAKKYTTISEEQWFQKWNRAIGRLVLLRFQGEATEDVLMRVMEREEEPPMPGTVVTGHAGIDGAVGMLAQGVRVVRAIQNGGDIGRGLQGGWGYDT